MDYVLYTSNAHYWDSRKAEYVGPTVEIVFFKEAGCTSVLKEVYGPNDAFMSLAFWLGIDAEKEEM